MNSIRVITTRQLQVLAFRCTSANEYGIETIIEQFFHAVDSMVELQVDAHVEDVSDFLINYIGRQSERWDVGAHEAAGRIESLEYRDFIPERTQVIGNGQRRTARANQGHLLAIAVLR